MELNNKALLNELSELLFQFIRRIESVRLKTYKLKARYDTLYRKQEMYLRINQNLVDFKSEATLSITDKNRRELKKCSFKVSYLSKEILVANIYLEAVRQDEKLARILYRKLKRDSPITNEEMLMLGRLLDRLHISEERQIYFFRAIESNNTYCFKSNLSAFYQAVSKERDAFLNYGYETLPKVLKPKRESIHSEIAGYVLCLKKKDETTKITEILPFLNLKFYSIEELKYIFYGIIMEINDEIFNLISLLKTKEYYCDKELKFMVISEISQFQELREEVMTYYDQIFSKIKMNETIDHEKKEVENILLFSHNGQRSHLMNDIDSHCFTREYLMKVQRLLLDFQSGTLSPKAVKVIYGCNDKKDHFQLSDFQVRIICQRLQGNYVVVKGVGIIQTESDRRVFNRITVRDSITISNENKLTDEILFSENEMQKVLTYCESNGRKGNR